mmetsp:Transcript_13153/g.30559  ORF Transcript_13153/g.30559 Transcript_13153/m.30559 type:complete len:201 (+) Transcript_13153:534-1136(+)
MWGTGGARPTRRSRSISTARRFGTFLPTLSNPPPTSLQSSRPARSSLPPRTTCATTRAPTGTRRGTRAVSGRTSCAPPSRFTPQSVQTHTSTTWSSHTGMTLLALTLGLLSLLEAPTFSRSMLSILSLARGTSCRWLWEGVPTSTRKLLIKAPMSSSLSGSTAPLLSSATTWCRSLLASGRRSCTRGGPTSAGRAKRRST